MRIGYACLVEGVEGTNFKSCILKNAEEEKLKEIIKHNLDSLNNILDYNKKNNINIFRITSDLIPFASKDIYTFAWEEYFFEEFKMLKEKINKYNMRVSMHPGQYTVINSPREEVVKNSIADLEYHAKLLNLLTDNKSHKMILHIGGVYGDKDKAKDRFIENYEKLSSSIKDRLVIENDDKSYTVEDVLEISEKANIPVVFDNLHNHINKSEKILDDREWILLCKKTWKKEDGIQKTHYSEQGEGKRIGSHSDTIDLDIFIDYYKEIRDLNIDIMLEVKDKNISAVKCINSTRSDKKIKYLEWEWARYKYSVLDKSHKSYLDIRELLKDKEEYPVEKFYKIINDALAIDIEGKEYKNGVLHVWGYFKDLVTEREKKRFLSNVDKLVENKMEIEKIKNSLKRLAEKYDIEFLLNSYYFYI